MRKAIAALAATGLLLAGCSAAAVQDRGAGAGKDPDQTKDATQVLVYLNADSVPNIAFFCTGDLRWASTLSGGDSGKDTAATIIRIPEQDAICTGKAR